MTERTPVATVADLDTLDEAEIIEGYHDGREGFPCGENRSRSYWHGWRNGMADSGRAKGDLAQAALAHEVVKSWYNRRTARGDDNG